MMTSRDLPLAVCDALTRLAESSDRTSPTVFAGREDEFGLLDLAVRGVRRKEAGHTVVIQGVPGAGKTALLNEYAMRLLAANDDMEKPTIAVPLQPDVLGEPPAAIVQEIDKQFREFEASDEWRRRMNAALSGASLVVNSLFAAFTKRDFNDFRTSAKAPNSLSAALEDYVAFRFDRRDSAVVLLVDEAQNLEDTRRVRAHLGTLHNSRPGRTHALLACFGLTNTTDRLRELGLSRLASRHVRSIGVLADEDAKRTVTETLAIALAGYAFEQGPFDEVERSRWIGAVADVILAESGNFPHHLANGCRALAEVVLGEGIGAVPPAAQVRQLCREYKDEYYDARLKPWARHKTALAHVFGNGIGKWMPLDEVKRVLASSDDNGEPVDTSSTSRIINELQDQGYIDRQHGACRAVLPSLATHFAEVRQAFDPNDVVVQAIRAAVPDQMAQVSKGHGR